MKIANEHDSPKVRQWTLKAHHRQTIFLCCMLGIPVLHFLIFWVGVNFNSLLLAFQNNAGEWIGWGNFKWFVNNFTQNPSVNMIEAVRNTLIFWCFSTFVEFPIAVILSYFFFRKISGHKTFRVILYLPSILSGVVMSTVYKSFIGSEGPLSVLWQMLGGNPLPKFLYDSRTAMPALLLYNLWTGSGINIILYTGAMSRIPNEIFESARLDGISPGREIISIILPLIWPLISITLILSIAGIFGASGPILLFTKGQYGTMTISYVMFQQYWEYSQITRAAAVGLVFTLVGVPLVLLSRWLLTKVGSDVEY